MIARKSFLVFLNMVVGSLFGYVALFYILRYMPSKDYGIIGFAMAYVGLFAFVSDLGFNYAHIKRVSEGYDLKKCNGTFLVIKVVLTFIMAVSVLLSIFIWKNVIGRGFQYPEIEPAIYIFLLYYIFVNLSVIPQATFAAKMETAKQQVPALLEPIVRTPITIIVALSFSGVLALSGAYLAGALVLFIASVVLFWGYPIGKFDSELFRSYLKFAIPIAVASSIIVISVNVDKVMIQLFWGSEQVGYYFGVQRLTQLIILISTAVTVLLFPTLSAHHKKNDQENIRNTTLLAERYVSLVTMPIAIMFIVFSRPILIIFDKEIADNAILILQIMAVYSLIFSILTISFNQILAVDRPGLSAKIGISIAVLNIILNTILIPKDIKSLGITFFGMGAEGAALATAISGAFGLVVAKIMTKRITQTKWNHRILLHLGAGVVMGIALYAIADFTNIFVIFDPQWAGISELLLYFAVLIIMGFIGFGIYLGILALSKEFTRDDLRLFFSVVHPGGMIRYVFSELRKKGE